MPGTPSYIITWVFTSYGRSARGDLGPSLFAAAEQELLEVLSKDLPKFTFDLEAAGGKCSPVHPPSEAGGWPVGFVYRASRTDRVSQVAWRRWEQTS